MTNNLEFKRLLELLDEAEKLAGQFTGGYSDHFFSAEEFHKGLKESITKLKKGNLDELDTLFVWFAPSYDWDDFVGSDGLNLGNEIFELLLKIVKSMKSNNIITLIKDYQQTVERVMTAFQTKFNTSDLLKAYRHDKIYPQIGELKEFGIKRYAFHGIGLAITFDDYTSVDFDFAFLPEQRHDGFDIWRLKSFADSRPGKYSKYLDKEKLENDFQELVKGGLIKNPDSNFSTTLYFFTDSLTKENRNMSENKTIGNTNSAKTERSWWQRLFKT